MASVPSGGPDPGDVPPRGRARRGRRRPRPHRREIVMRGFAAIRHDSARPARRGNRVTTPSPSTGTRPRQAASKGSSILAVMTTNVPKTGAPFKPTDEDNRFESPCNSVRSLQTECVVAHDVDALPPFALPKAFLRRGAAEADDIPPKIGGAALELDACGRHRLRAVEDDGSLRQPFEHRTVRARERPAAASPGCRRTDTIWWRPAS